MNRSSCLRHILIQTGQTFATGQQLHGFTGQSGMNRQVCVFFKSMWVACWFAAAWFVHLVCKIVIASRIPPRHLEASRFEVLVAWRILMFGQVTLGWLGVVLAPTELFESQWRLINVTWGSLGDTRSHLGPLTRPIGVENKKCCFSISFSMHFGIGFC